MGGGGPGKRRKTKDEEGKQSLNNGFLSYVYTIYYTHCLLSSLFSPSYYTRTVFFRAEERTFVSAPRPAGHYLYVHPILHCVCCAVLCCAGAAIEKESFYISKQEEEKPFKPLLVSPAHIILMRPPLVPYNPVITLTWTFSFFGFFSVLRRPLFFVFSRVFLFFFWTLEGRLVYWYTQGYPQRRGRRWSASAQSRHQHGGGGSFPRTPSCCVTISLERHPESLLPIPAALPLYYCCCKRRQHSTCSASIHPSISYKSRQNKRSQTALFNGYIFIRPEFFNAAHVISSVFIR